MISVISIKRTKKAAGGIFKNHDQRQYDKKSTFVARAMLR